jgi:hypothetical protein
MGSGLSLCHSGPKECYTQCHPESQNVRTDAFYYAMIALSALQ